ncbi:hypothetical protein [Biomaibacter acetigenes]|jgi:hypothetical protein|uniref:hypothetical protein n=1 Tax=Biomaibacter acetigenes TaxID=2316383 RepID=UPI0013CEC356|nr:hypothetical protein [Biomaibacter acetigenes]
MTELLKRKIIISAACLFTLVGTVAAIEPMCMGRFYPPHVPEILKGPIKKKKGIV